MLITKKLASSSDNESFFVIHFISSEFHENNLHIPTQSRTNMNLRFKVWFCNYGSLKHIS